jgi:hypothetical protein
MFDFKGDVLKMISDRLPVIFLGTQRNDYRRQALFLTQINNLLQVMKF